jgi:glycosyltransferase involved in cell wall biosynthesis
MTNLIAIIVIPCLNEQDTLMNTCISLGFGTEKYRVPLDAYLFLIDNGSTDRTLAVAETVCNNSPKGHVLIDYEAERGYVPPRHYGNLLAKKLAFAEGWNAQDILIIQADADTQYSAGYVDNMRVAAEMLGPGVLIESCSEYPPDFTMTYRGYVELCDRADKPVLVWINDNGYDVVIDDKTCAYRLHDYFEWGAHQREYTIKGEEIYAETTRLYMRAKAKNCRRFRVDSATVQHSARKILYAPALEIATAGFPREASWKYAWHKDYQGPNTLEDIFAHIEHSEIQRAIRKRQMHTIALFGVLPLHVALAAGHVSIAAPATSIQELTLSLPQRDKRTLSTHPGIFLTDVFSLVDENENMLNAIITHLAW